MTLNESSSGAIAADGDMRDKLDPELDSQRRELVGLLEQLTGDL